VFMFCSHGLNLENEYVVHCITYMYAH
jgi:hypothetical protein